MRSTLILGFSIALAAAAGAQQSKPVDRLTCLTAYSQAATAALQDTSAEEAKTHKGQLLMQAAELVETQYGAVGSSLCSPQRVEKAGRMRRAIEERIGAVQAAQIKQQIAETAAALDALPEE